MMRIVSPENKFWSWFEHSQDKYMNLETADMEEKFSIMSEKIREVHEDLTFAISPQDAEGKRELIISADGVQTAFPWVIKLVRKAPVLPQWQIKPFRPKVEMDEYHIDLGHRIIKAEEIRFEFQIIEGRLELHLYIEGYHPEAEDILIASQILLDSLLGEYDAATKIQFLAFHELGECPNPDLLPRLELLPMLIEDLNRGKIEGTLPILPQTEEESEGYEVEEGFALLRGMFNHFPNYLLINPNFYQFSRKREFPWLLSLTFIYNPASHSGQPDDPTKALLDSIEKQFITFINQHTRAYLVYQMTWNGQRQVFFHLEDWLEVEDAVKKWVGASQIETEFEIAYERDWESTRAMLYLLFEAQQGE